MGNHGRSIMLISRFIEEDIASGFIVRVVSLIPTVDWCGRDRTSEFGMSMIAINSAREKYVYYPQNFTCKYGLIASEVS